MEANFNSSSVVGLDSPKTMKFTRVIGGKQVLVLLDSGATHNFISDCLIDELQVPVEPTTFVMVLGVVRRSRESASIEKLS